MPAYKFPDMPGFLKVLLAGLVVSFLGSLPLGTTNVMVMKLSVERGFDAAVLFSVGSLSVELIYVRLSLFAVDWLRSKHRVMRYLNAITLVVLILLAVESFYSAANPVAQAPIAISQVLPPLLFGMFLCSISTAQIPFWLGWSAILMEKKILPARGRTYWNYLLGIGMGTFLANALFMYSGHLAGDAFQKNPSIIQWVIGTFYSLTALWQGWRLVRSNNKNQVR